MRRSSFRARRTVPAGDHLDPLGTADLTMLASDCGPVPMHLAAVLLLDGADDGTTNVPDALVARAGRVPRLVQVLVGPPRRPAWWTDPAAQPARHVTTRHLPSGDEQAVLDEAAALVCTPLDPSRSLWSACWLTGWDTSPARRGALVVVLHHALVDGLGGLGVLAALADHEEPGDRTTAGTASASRSSGAAARGLRAWLHGLLELGLGARLPVVAARTSLNRPTGSRRRLGLVRAPLASVHEGAHRRGGSVNDAIVGAVVGALEHVLAARGENPRRLVVSVPVTGRAAGDRGAGNDNGMLPVVVATGLGPEARVRQVAAATGRRKARPRGRSALPLGAAFRGLAAVGLFRAFVEHQRLIHTFETNVRGPGHRLHLAGYEVSAILPAAVTPGNVGVSFAALSYAGELTVMVVTDPDVIPESTALVAALAAELETLTQVKP